MQMPQEEWLLRLYVSGRGWLTSRTETNLESLCRQYLKGRYRIDVIDLQENPALAREHEIVAVPMLVREAPVPIRKVFGDLSDTRRALLAFT
jgi:circadian clock protein KaiB